MGNHLATFTARFIGCGRWVLGSMRYKDSDRDNSSAEEMNAAWVVRANRKARARVLRETALAWNQIQQKRARPIKNKKTQYSNLSSAPLCCNTSLPGWPLLCLHLRSLGDLHKRQSWEEQLLSWIWVDTQERDDLQVQNAELRFTEAWNGTRDD